MSFLPICSLLMNWIIMTKVLFLGEVVVDAFWSGGLTTTRRTTLSEISNSSPFLQRNAKSIHPPVMVQLPKRITNNDNKNSRRMLTQTVVRNLVPQQQTTSSIDSNIPSQNDDNSNNVLPTRRRSNNIMNNNKNNRKKRKYNSINSPQVRSTTVSSYTKDQYNGTTTNVPTSSQRRRPYEADYYTSCVSQQLIKNSVNKQYDYNNNPKISTTTTTSPLQRATTVLETFLQIPAHQCNAANVVCALTLSAKVMGRETDEHFRSLLQHIIVSILEPLIQNEKLSARQLCNVIWALAKHYDRDNELLPPVVDIVSIIPATSTSSKSVSILTGQTELWDLRYDLDNCPAIRFNRLVDTIALQLIQMLSTNYYIAKECELCMACWAYGIVRKRRRPPGWQNNPLMSPINREHSSSTSPQQQQQQQQRDSSRSISKKESSNDVIKFEQWITKIENELLDESASDNIDDDDNNEHDDYEKMSNASPTALLFNKIGEALCAPLNPNVITTAVPATDLTNIESRIRSCQWSELANLVWSYASVGHIHSHPTLYLIQTIAREATRRLQVVANRNDDTTTGTTTRIVLSRDISQIIWSLGTLLSDNYRLADQFVAFVDAVTVYTQVQDVQPGTRPFRTWSCTDLVQVASSLAHARLDATPLLQSLYTEAYYRLNTSQMNVQRSGSSTPTGNDTNGANRITFLPWEVSVLMWAQARLYLKFTDDAILSKFTNVAVDYIRSSLRHNSMSFGQVGLGAQEQANIAWSLTVLEMYESEGIDLLKSIFQEAVATCDKNKIMQLEHAHQLWQAYCLIEDVNTDCIKDVPQWFRHYLEGKWELEKARLKISSARHKSLSQTLNLMRVSHMNEHDEDIDVAIILKPNAVWSHQTTSSTEDKEWDGSATGIKIAVEFDGPNHFTRQVPSLDGPASQPSTPRALGHTILKYRLLKKKGWTVIRVPYYEYDKIPFWSSMERQRYLQRLLKTHGNIQFSSVDVSTYRPPVPSKMSRYD